MLYVIRSKATFAVTIYVIFYKGKPGDFYYNILSATSQLEKTLETVLNILYIF